MTPCINPIPKRRQHGRSRIGGLAIALVLTLGGLLLSWSAQSQTARNLSESQTKAALLYNFIKHTQWPDESTKGELRIGFFDTNASLFKDFSHIAAEAKVREKRLALFKIHDMAGARNMNVVVVPASMNSQLEDLASRMLKSGALMITENANNDRVIMINFTQPDRQHLSFQINRSNIVYEGLNISNDVLLHGGTEIEVATLYKQMEQSLRGIKDQVVAQNAQLQQQQRQLLEQTQRIDEQKQAIENYRAKIDAAELSLTEKNARISSRENQLLQLEAELAEKRAQFEHSQQALARSQEELDNSLSQLGQQKEAVVALGDRIANNQRILDDQQQALAIQEAELARKNQVVFKQEETISSQRNIIVLALILLLIITIVIIVRQKHALNRERQLLKTEAELVKAQQASIAAFESSLKLKNDFLTAINHELRTPMNGVLGAIQLADTHDPESLRISLDIIEKSAGEMMTLVDDILTYTEIQSEQIIVKQEPMHLPDFLKSLHDHYQRICQDKNLQLLWSIDPSMPPYVELDSRKIEKVLRKLLDNAVKFTPKGQISLCAEWQTGEDRSVLNLTIDDTGPGISDSEQARLMEAFNQGEGGLSRRHGGLGIGLSICHSLVNALDGMLNFSSRDQGGCHITITLPVRVSETIPRAIPNPQQSAQQPIMVVEDNVVNQQILQKMLERLGYHSFVVNNGQEALDAISQANPSLVLMDLQMPVMDGVTCTRHIRSRRDDLKNTPIIALTANLIDSQQSGCLEAGMNAYLGKPVKLELLRETIEHFIQPANLS